MISKYFSCDCESEILRVSHFPDDDDDLVYLSIYSYGNYNKLPTFFERLKFAFHYIRTGKLYYDNIILNGDKTKELSEHLNLINEMKHKKNK